VVNKLYPVAVNTLGALSGKSFKDISIGLSNHVCILANDSNAYCWGFNS
jgi:hypothetical protein